MRHLTIKLVAILCLPLLMTACNDDSKSLGSLDIVKRDSDLMCEDPNYSASTFFVTLDKDSTKAWVGDYNHFEVQQTGSTQYTRYGSDYIEDHDNIYILTVIDETIVQFFKDEASVETALTKVKSYLKERFESEGTTLGGSLILKGFIALKLDKSSLRLTGEIRQKQYDFKCQVLN